MGLFVTLPEPMAPMKKEAASAGVLDTPFGKFARLQIITIEDLTAIGTTSGARAHRLPFSPQLRSYASDVRTAEDDP